METPTILCVDDERNVLLTLRAQLQRHFPNCEVELAESGVEGLELIEELRLEGREVCLVIADQIMSGMRGDQFLIELHQRYPQILKVMLTGQATAEEVGNAVNRANLYRFLSKPWNELDLCLTVGEALRRYQQDQQLAQQQIALAQVNQELEALNADLDQQIQQRTQSLQQEITSRQQVESELRISEERYRLLSEMVPVGIFRHDLQGRCIYANTRAQEITGLTLAPEQPEDWQKHLHPRDRERVAADWAEFVEQVQQGQAAEYQTEYQTECRYLQPEGSLRWVVLRAVPDRDASGTLVGFVGSMIDISDRKQAEAQIQCSEQQLQLTLDFTGIGAWSWHPVSGAYSWNGQMQELLELPPGLDNMFQIWCDRIHPDDIDRVTTSIQKALDAHCAFAEEYRYRLANGQIVWRWVKGQGIYSEIGAVERVLGVVQDITDRKQAEADLRQSEAKTRAILEAMPDCLLRLGRDGSCYDFIPPIHAQTNVFVPVRQHISEVLPLDLWQYQQQRMERAFATGELQTWEHQILKNGRLCDEEVRLVPCGPDECLVIVRDISDRKRAEQSLQRTNQLLSAISAAQSRFITEADPGILFDNLLETLLELTQSEYGFIGEVLYDETGSTYIDESYMKMRGRPYLKTKAITNIAGDEDTRRLYEMHVGQGMELQTLNTLFGQVMATGQPVISNRPRTDPRRGGLPSGHPPLNAFLGIPFFRGEQLVGMVGIANRPDGYSEAVITELEPFLMTCTSMIEAYRNEARRKQTEVALRTSQATKNAIILALPDLLIRMDRSGHNKELISSQYLKVLLPDRPIEESTVYDVLPADVAEQRLHYARLALETGVLQVYEQLLEIAGQMCCEEVRISPLHENEVLVIVRDITARKQAEIALQEKQQQLTSLLNNIPHIAWLKDRESRFLAVNEPFAQSCGYAAADLVGLTDRDIWPPELAEAYRRDDREVMDCGRQKRVEEPLQTASGEVQWIETIKTPILNMQGESIGTAGIAMDITQRKRAELALQQLNEELEQRVQARTQELARSGHDLRTIFNNVYDAVMIHALDGTILDANDRALELRGARRDQLIGSNVLDLSAPDAPLDQLPEILQRVQAGETMRFEWRERRFDDQVCFDVEVSLRQVTLGNRPVFIAGVRDISDRKRAEAALQSERLRLQLALDAAEMGTWSCSLETGRLYWSDRAQEIFGFVPGSFPGDRETFLSLVYPDDLDRVVEAIDRTFTTGAPYNIEYRIHRLDGTLRWIAVWGIIPQGMLPAERQLIGVVCDVTERKQAEQDVQDSRNMLKLVLDTIPQRVFWKDRQSRFLGCNPAFANDYAMTHEQIIGKTDLELPWAKWAHLYRQDDAEVMRTGRSKLNYEEPTNNLRGERIWIRSSKIPLTDSQGAVIGILGCYDDITDRKQAEQALLDSEERLRLALTATNQGLYDLNIQTGIAIVSPEYATMLGYDPKTFQETNARWIERLHPDDMDAVAATYRAYVAGELSTYRVEFRQRTQNGQWKWILSLGRIVSWDENGQPLRMLGTHTDIDERKHAEAQLREQEQFLRSIYEGANQPIFVGDVLPDCTIQVVGCNPTATKLTGRLSQEIAGKTVTDLFPHQAAAEVLERYAQCIAYQQPLTFEECITFQGETRWMLTTHNPLINQDGIVYRVVSTLYDITDRKQLEQDLRQINAELEQRVAERTRDLQHAMEAAQAANHAKTTFLSNMSHELRTPLNAILGFSQLLSRDDNLTLEQQERVSIINRSGEHLLNLINDILAMSKIESGRITLTVNRFDLRSLLKDLEELFRLKAEAKQLVLQIEIDALIPALIQTDEGKLRQVLINLLSNAIKFTSQGSVILRVWAEEPLDWVYRTDADRFPDLSPIALSFEVEDTGCGIDPAEHTVVFEPFGQTQAGRTSQEGTGLGLPISRQFVQLMGGELRFVSQCDRGSTFFFTIPVEGLQPDECSPATSTCRVLGLAADQPSYRLLVVEDNPENRQFLVQLLRSTGFEVQVAINGQEAVRLWQSWRPDLIWMDMRMPVLDGYTATRQIRALERHIVQKIHGHHSQAAEPPATKILALTASAFEDERAIILAAGCDDFLFKPVTEALLFEKMAQHLGLRYIYQEQTESTDQLATMPDDIQTSCALQTMPSEWIAQLRLAARIADEDLILSLLDQLPPDRSELANHLKELVRELQLEKLIQLTQQADQSRPVN